MVVVTLQTPIIQPLVVGFGGHWSTRFVARTIGATAVPAWAAGGGGRRLATASTVTVGEEAEVGE